MSNERSPLVPKTAGYEAASQQTNLTAKTGKHVAIDTALLLIGLPLSIASLYCMRFYGEEGSKRFINNDGFAEVAGIATFSLQMMLSLFAFISIGYGLTNGVSKYRDPSNRNAKTIIKDLSTVVTTLATTTQAGFPGANSTYQKINTHTGFSPLATALFANGTYYDSLNTNSYFFAELVRAALDATGLFDAKMHKNDMRFLVRRITRLANTHLPKIAAKNQQQFLTLATRFKQGDLNERFAVITEIARIYEQEIGEAAFIKQLTKCNTKLKLSLIPKLLVAVFSVIGVFMTSLKLGLSIPEELISLLQPNIILGFLARTPNALQGVASGLVNVAQNGVSAFAFLTILLNKNSWNIPFIGLFVVSMIGASLNLFALLGLALDQPLFDGDTFWAHAGNLLQAVSSSFGAALSGSYGLIGLLLYLGQEIQRFAHRQLLQSNQQVDFSQLYNRQNPAKQKAMVTFLLSELTSALTRFEDTIANKEALAIGLTSQFDQAKRSSPPSQPEPKEEAERKIDDREQHEDEASDTGYYQSLQTKLLGN